MKESIYMLILQHQILKAKKRHGEYCYHIKQFILTSANPYYNFHILFIYYILYFPLGTCTLYFPCFSFFLIDCTWKHAVHFSDLYLFRKRSIIGQLNVQATTAENQEQYTLHKHNIHWISKFILFSKKFSLISSCS